MSDNLNSLPKNPQSPLQPRLASNPWLLNLWAATAAFATYFSVYMYRKPITAAIFENGDASGWGQKSVLLASQVIGYLVAKIIGVRVISSLSTSKRGATLVAMVAGAHWALLIFALVPSPLHVIAMFLNGLALGMVFGLVLGFLEGRRMTEALTAGLCVSFIVAGGFAKTIGSWVLNYMTGRLAWSLESAERWMPFCAGLLFLVPLLFSVWMLTRIPPPNDLDIEARSGRVPMDAADRRALIRNRGIGIACIALMYLLMTIMRSFRDDFAPELFAGLGFGVVPSDYATIDMAVAVIVMVANGMSVLVMDNRRALLLSLAVCFAGFVTTMSALALVEGGTISARSFMILLGAGLYLPYVAVHTTVFERMIALTRDRGNLGFLLYLVDSVGYFGYAVIMLLFNWLSKSESGRSEHFLQAFRWTCWFAVIISILCTLVATVYFARKGIEGKIKV